MLSFSEQKPRKFKSKEESEDGDFDDLVSALRTGEWFDVDGKSRRQPPKHNMLDGGSQERPVTKRNQ